MPKKLKTVFIACLITCSLASFLYVNLSPSSSPLENVKIEVKNGGKSNKQKKNRVILLPDAELIHSFLQKPDELDH